MTERFIIDISPEKFLATFWGQRPYFMPKAFELQDAAISPDELAGLAGEEFVESRLIIHDSENRTWQLKSGPLSAKDFRRLPEKEWTILVQDVDKFLPSVADLIEATSFLPHYWLDDVMVSYAREGGSVGAHLDRYHVFLVQASGKRKWMLEDTARSDEDYIPDIDIRLLKQFNPTLEFVATKGDVLYIPPYFAHHGVALDHNCVTYSIGFRAPSLTYMLSSFAKHLEEKNSDEKLLEDPRPKVVLDPGKVQLEHINMAKDFLKAAIDDTPSFVEWLGCFLSEPKFRLESEVESQEVSPYLVRDENCRAYYFDDLENIKLFVDGTAREVPVKDREIVQAICNNRKVKWGDRQIPTWLSDLISSGLWYWA